MWSSDLVDDLQLADLLNFAKYAQLRKMMNIFGPGKILYIYIYIYIYVCLYKYADFEASTLSI